MNEISRTLEDGVRTEQEVIDLDRLRRAGAAFAEYCILNHRDTPGCPALSTGLRLAQTIAEYTDLWEPKP